MCAVPESAWTHPFQHCPREPFCSGTRKNTEQSHYGAFAKNLSVLLEIRTELFFNFIRQMTWSKIPDELVTIPGNCHLLYSFIPRWAVLSSSQNDRLIIKGGNTLCLEWLLKVVSCWGFFHCGTWSKSLMSNNCFIYCTERYLPDILLYLWLAFS